MPSLYSNSSPSNSPITLDSEASKIVISDSDSDDDSVTSSIFGFTCQICELRAKNATELEYKYLEDDLSLLDSNGVHWGKCDACGSCGHLVCWEDILVIKFNGTTGSIVVSMWLSGALLCIFLC